MRFWRKCQNFKGLAAKVLGRKQPSKKAALDQKEHFDLIYTIIEAFILMIDNTVV